MGFLDYQNYKKLPFCAEGAGLERDQGSYLEILKIAISFLIFTHTI